MIYMAEYFSPLGKICIAEKNGFLIGLWIEGQMHFLSSIREDVPFRQDSPLLHQTMQWLDRYFQGAKPSISELPLAPSGSTFRQAVWKLLCEIPYGSVTTYGELARRIAHQQGLERMSAQAVGGAVGHNPISIIIPCHRVIGANGSLTGYAGGLDKKTYLLALEGVTTYSRGNTHILQ